MKKSIFAVALLSAGTAWAQANNLPPQPINIIVGFAAGGSTDTVARIVGKELSERLKRTVVVVNKPGASGTIAAAEVGRAKPDSNTFLMMTTPTLLARHVYKDIRFDVTQELTPISIVYDMPNVLVVNKKHTPEVNNLQDVIQFARKKPGGVSFGSGGTGSMGQLLVEDLKKNQKFEAEHIPYQGGAPALMALLGGQIDMVSSESVAALPHIRSGKLHAVAVGSAERLNMFPGTPTFAEQGMPGFTSVAWGSFLGPKSIPPQTVALLTKEMREILNDPKVRDQLLKAGAIAVYGDPEQTARRLREDDKRWGDVARNAGISIN